MILETPLITGIDHRPRGELVLKQNYPNPFNPSTTISFVLPREAHSRLQIYDVRGQLVATLIDRVLAPGEHAVQWDAHNVSSGLYFYKLETPGFKETRKMVLLK